MAFETMRTGEGRKEMRTRSRPAAVNAFRPDLIFAGVILAVLLIGFGIRLVDLMLP